MSLAVDKIKGADLLTNSDIDIVSSLSEELQKTFEKKELFRTEFLARTSVLNDVKFPDPASKYWQAVREQDAMLTNLVLDSFEHKKALANIDILECEKDEIKGTDKKSNALRQKKNIEIDERKFYCINVKLNAHHRVRELALWEKIKNEIESNLLMSNSSILNINIEGVKNENPESIDRLFELLDEDVAKVFRNKKEEIDARLEQKLSEYGI